MSKTDTEPFDFWNDHSLQFLEMAMKRDFQETVETSDGYGTASRDCGDTIEFFLMKAGERLSAISYDLKGCLFSHACVNTIIHLAAGKTIEAARALTPRDIIDFLKTLPKAEEHCARHALKAFTMALDSLES